MQNGALNLLLASSSDTSASIQLALEPHFSDFYIHRVETKDALSEALGDKQWSLLFSEMNFADFSATDLPEMFEKHGLSIPVALIVDNNSVTVINNEATSCLDHGICALVQCEKQYLQYLPITVSALLKQAYNAQQKSLETQQLLESEARYQALYDLAPNIYTILNDKGEILSVNQTGLDILGYSKDELIGNPIIEFVHAEDGSRVMEHIKEVFITGNDSVSIEYRKVRKDGSVLWVHNSVKFDDDAGVPRLLVVCRDITVQRELQEKLTFHATHDSLTQLINRRELESRLRRVLTEMSVHEDHALCFLDLDEFKVINDVNGHAAGDELLRQITGILHENIRSRDTLARIGGDEFVVLMEHCPLPAAVKLAEKFNKIISEFEFCWRAQTFNIGVSIGIIPLQAQASVDKMLSDADSACYKAKDSGRNCIFVDELK